MTKARNLPISITRAKINDPTLSTSSVTWSASSRTFTISSTSYMTVTPPSGWTRDDTEITIPASKAVGNYSVSVTPDSNHQWNYETPESSVTGTRYLEISIGRASLSLPTLSKTSTDYSTSSQSFT